LRTVPRLDDARNHRDGAYGGPPTLQCHGTALKGNTEKEEEKGRGMTGPDGTPNRVVRVVLADDHGPFRRGVAEMLSLAGDIEVVAEADDHEGAVAAASEHAPDVVLLDLEMPGDVGADESLRRMLSLPSPPRVVVLTMHDEPGMIRRFLSRGAVGYFPKSAEMGELVEAVREAVRARPAAGGRGAT
jgi:CheY-like chemotaxis protein